MNNSADSLDDSLENSLGYDRETLGKDIPEEEWTEIPEPIVTQSQLDALIRRAHGEEDGPA